MSNGSFSGSPKTEWVSEDGVDREMRLLEDFWYRDPAGKRWDAPKGSVVNGASIPEALWSSVGSPYTGAYRRASVVHDVACNNTTIKREDADDMFYWACLSGGCSKLQAKMLYLGVRLGAWSSRDTVTTFNKVKVKPRLADEHSRQELVLRSKYNLIADRLANAPDDFSEIKSIVDEELSQRNGN